MINQYISSSFSAAKRNKKNNEDNILPATPIGDIIVMAIADGIGGQPGGHEASKIAIKELQSILTVHKLVSVSAIFANIKNSIETHVLTHAEHINMGTTLTFVIIKENSATIGHTGDCRAYLLRNNKIKQITKDHTQIQHLIDNKIIRKQHAHKLNIDNILTHAISSNTKLHYDEISIKIKKGDSLIILSDGVHKQIDITKLNLTQNIHTEISNIFEIVHNNHPLDDHSATCITIL